MAPPPTHSGARTHHFVERQLGAPRRASRVLLYPRTRVLDPVLVPTNRAPRQNTYLDYRSANAEDFSYIG